MPFEKYELRDGEEYIDEYINEEGKHVTIVKESSGNIIHGWVMDIDPADYALIEKAAALEGVDIQDFIDSAIKSAILLAIDEVNMKSAIEDISD